MSTISCIIVCYNNDEYIEEAISSVIHQTRKVDEIIVADDGSTDLSREIIMKYARSYSNIKPLFRESNIGVAANRDLAIRVATGELVTTLDGDDLFLPTKIEKEERALNNDFNSVAFSDIKIMDRKGNRLSVFSPDKLSTLTHLERLCWIAQRQGPIPRDMLMSKNIYLAAGGFRHGLSLYEDWDLKLRLELSGAKWVSTGEIGIAYRRTGSGLSTAKSFRHVLAQVGILLANRKKLRMSLGYAGQLKLMADPFIRPVMRKLGR